MLPYIQRVRRSALPLVLVLALVVTACGGGDAAVEEIETAVVVTLWPDGEAQGGSLTAQLACAPAVGSLPDNAAACTALGSDDGRAALDPVPAGAMCTELYGGPAEARIVGMVDGDPVDAHLSRVTGCEIERWQALAALLPA